MNCCADAKSDKNIKDNSITNCIYMKTFELNKIGTLLTIRQLFNKMRDIFNKCLSLGATIGGNFPTLSIFSAFPCVNKALFHRFVISFSS